MRQNWAVKVDEDRLEYDEDGFAMQMRGGSSWFAQYGRNEGTPRKELSEEKQC